MGEPEDGALRASDADREAVAERLRRALDEGRLTLSEYDERLSSAYAAVTMADLRPLTADLPAPVRAAEVDRRDRRRRKIVKEWRDWAGTGLVLVAIWGVSSVVSGELKFFWPGVVLAIWGAIILADMLFGGRKRG
ncbi:DUF1707 SHOCT-like domain-containing protein [Saccharopolyspora rosea]|uniref:DUF1707 domain-containing protein n=1 Tax=Saccharopolyspora rosea TaxID=524884 RepID=A0ABW3FPV3_9PSEU|nr:DUF1707 domain-containing protein [Saccharopolyspora rosea]